MMSGGEGFIDRSKVRILLCDNDTKSSLEVFTLLSKCSYQVTRVNSPRQVIHALNAEGPDIDIILSEVDLPTSKGFKMLKYIMRDRELQRIPVIMMSAQDEVSIVVKCLKYGAADYLLKPLRTNELLNLWTHMWRQRRMSTAVAAPALVFASAAIEISVRPSEQCFPDVPIISDQQTGKILSFPMKSELRIGESSAFFTYVKSNALKNSSKTIFSKNENVPQCLRIDNMLDASPGQVNLNKRCSETGEPLSMDVQVDDSPSTSCLPNSFPAERSSTPLSFDFSQGNSKKSIELHAHSRNGFVHDTSRHPKNGLMVQGIQEMGFSMILLGFDLLHITFPG